ncbi:hypothetical protein KIW84_061033 [Lathyrus oleraceus]|uniref:NADH dehydrogenase [ubiquinone] 1 alpha subcomplex subunit 12 n=1 Tax=Pisum sativum TaxID=3888 RepID=A0A9D4W4B4_PEA|nr:hypothetical protein KIW84_061033 [Pisum sativum]
MSMTPKRLWDATEGTLGGNRGRHRWVEYAEKTRYNASQVPAEWHGWLHFITDHTGDEEIQTLLAFAVLAFIKGIREETWEAFIADALFIAKLWYFYHKLMSVDYGLCIVILLTFVIGNWTVLIKFKSCFRIGFIYSLTVEFSASYSSACIRSSQQFPELSITYSTKLLSFGIVDLGLFPNAAEKFGVSLSGSMGQLPTYILFENAAEVSRFPELGSETTFFNPTITKGLLSRHFELDRHLLEYVNSK